ncbi:MAG: helix-turn-helix domain-containing protein [Planctomycetota bacterium]
MNPSSKIIGRHVRSFRRRSGLTQTELANEMGFKSKETISQIERGDRDLKAWELAQLANFLSVEMNELLRSEERQPDPIVLWREVPKNKKKLSEAAFIKRCQDYALLEQLSGIQIGRELPQKKTSIDSISYEVANVLANEIRREFNLGDRPAREIEKTLENGYGVKIWHSELDEGSAASTIGQFGYAILMNSNEAPWRRNYNFAHELFHLITWESIPPKIITKRSENWEYIEKIANVFASTLLLPADAVSEEFERNITDNKIIYGDLIGIARNFDVSTEALLYRLVNLKRLDKKIVKDLLSDRLFRDIDRATMAPSWWEPPEIPERFVRLAFIAYQKGRLSKSKFAEFLDTSLIDLPQTLQNYGLSDRDGYNAEVRAA